MAGILSREQERAIFAKDRKDIAGMQSQRNLLHIREGNVPSNNAVVSNSFRSAVQKLKDEHKENKNSSQARKASQEQDKKNRKLLIEADAKVLQEKRVLLNQLQSGKISKDQYHELIGKLEKDKPKERGDVLPKDYNKKNVDQARRDFEKFRHPNPIFPHGSGAQRNNDQTGQPDSSLTLKEQRRLGVENPTKIVGREGTTYTVPVEYPEKILAMETPEDYRSRSERSFITPEEIGTKKPTRPAPSNDDYGSRDEFLAVVNAIPSAI